MPLQVSQLSERPSWKALKAHRSLFDEKNIKELFAEDPQRGEKMNLNAQVQRRIFKALDQRLFQQRQTT